MGQCVQLEFYSYSLHGTQKGVCFPISAHRCQEPLEALTTIQQKQRKKGLPGGSRGRLYCLDDHILDTNLVGCIEEILNISCTYIFEIQIINK